MDPSERMKACDRGTGHEIPYRKRNFGLLPHSPSLASKERSHFEGDL